MTTIQPVHYVMSTAQTEVSIFVITEEPLTPCNQASNMYRMYVIDKSREAQEIKNGRKKQNSTRRVECSKEKERTTGCVTSQILVYLAD